ncbi:Ion channel [Carpediemonas membranifera]|uniref:Ion channel n=1 Tax=Carpediemonas membranifera TaxID=201153 RepID=A0A8J6E137_9EUKA|nr:Ion channel [Carpediemonas membranifera]|eukprot:KAG9392963.1 Ion channel [Carpediemonas membranifera]
MKATVCTEAKSDHIDGNIDGNEDEPIVGEEAEQSVIRRYLDRTWLVNFMRDRPRITLSYFSFSAALSLVYIGVYILETIVSQGPGTRDLFNDVIFSEYPRVVELIPSLSDYSLSMDTIAAALRWINFTIPFWFIVDYTFAFFTTPNLLRFLVSPVVLLSLVPMPFSWARPWAEFVPSLAFLRILHVYWCSSYIIPAINNLTMLLVKLVVVGLTFVVAAAGLMHLIEVVVFDMQQEYRFHFFDSMYFILSSMSTVGFGDVVAISIVGRFFIIAVILVTVLYVPIQTNKIYRILQTNVEYGSFSKKAGDKHIVVTGSVTPDGLRLFLDSFFNGKKNAGKKVVVMITRRWDETIEKEISATAPIPGIIHFIKGSFNDPADLARADIRRASEMYILSGGTHEALDDDSEVVEALLSVVRQNRALPICLQVLNADTARVLQDQLDHVVQALNPLDHLGKGRRMVTFLAFRDLTYSVLSTAAVVPGLSTFVHSVVRTFKDSDLEAMNPEMKLMTAKLMAEKKAKRTGAVSDHLKHAGLLVDIKENADGTLGVGHVEAPEWLQLYAQGLAYSVYRSRVPLLHGGQTYGEMSVDLFQQGCIVALGVEVTDGTNTELFLNPPPDYRVVAGQPLFVLARSSREADMLRHFGEETYDGEFDMTERTSLNGSRRGSMSSRRRSVTVSNPIVVPAEPQVEVITVDDVAVGANDDKPKERHRHRHRKKHAEEEALDADLGTEPDVDLPGPMTSHLMESDVDTLPRNYIRSVAATPRTAQTSAARPEGNGCSLVNRVADVKGHTVFFGRLERFYHFVDFAAVEQHTVIVFLTPDSIPSGFYEQYSDRTIFVVNCPRKPTRYDFDRCNFTAAKAIIVSPVSSMVNSNDSLVTGLMLDAEVKQIQLTARPHITVESNGTKQAILTSSETETRYFFSHIFQQSSFFSDDWHYQALPSAYSNPAALKFLNRLFLDRADDNATEAAHRFRLVPLPPTLAGMAYGDVYKELAIQGLTTVGLYRRLADGSGPAFVTFIVPPPDTDANNDDQLLIIR